jgi:hypothetical protein
VCADSSSFITPYNTFATFAGRRLSWSTSISVPIWRPRTCAYCNFSVQGEDEFIGRKAEELARTAILVSKERMNLSGVRLKN